MIFILAFIILCFNIIFLKNVLSKIDDRDEIVNKI
jgi:hypothetical protein